MAEPMSNERLATCRDLPQIIRRQTWNAAEDAADAIRDLAAEVDGLRARLAEIGETTVEWGYRETYPNGTVFTETECDRECAERAIGRTVLPAKLIRRLAGEWREVEQEADRG